MSGKRERYFFETKAEAEMYAESQRIRLENFGTRGASILRRRSKSRPLHEKLLNTITPADLTRAMDGTRPSVRNFTIRILGGLFNFGIKRGFCVDNPVRRLDLFPTRPI